MNGPERGSEGDGWGGESGTKAIDPPGICLDHMPARAHNPGTVSLASASWLRARRGQGAGRPGQRGEKETPRAS